jgi:hypothetical protein
VTSGVSLIHGARRPFERLENDRRWMGALAAYFAARGLDPIDRFEWSGGFLRSYCHRVHAEYAARLAAVWNNGRVRYGPSFRLHVFAKSNGAFIVERALRLLAQQGSDVTVDTFLRIATADPRGAVYIPGIHRIVSVSCPEDRLYRTGEIVAGSVLRGAYVSAADASTPHEHVIVRGVSHEQFNCDGQILVGIGPARTTYALYADILMPRVDSA